MRRAIGIFTTLTTVLLIITIMTSTGGCASPEPENVFMELLSLLPAEAREVPVITIVNYKIYEDNAISLYDGEGNRISIDGFIEIFGEKSVNRQLAGESALPVYDSFYTGVNIYVLYWSIK